MQGVFEKIFEFVSKTLFNLTIPFCPPLFIDRCFGGKNNSYKLLCWQSLFDKRIESSGNDVERFVNRGDNNYVVEFFMIRERKKVLKG